MRDDISIMHPTVPEDADPGPIGTEPAFRNRAQRRAAARKKPKPERNIVKLIGGPMEGWTVTKGSPVLRTPRKWGDDGGHEGRYSKPVLNSEGQLEATWQPN